MAYTKKVWTEPNNKIAQGLNHLEEAVAGLDAGLLSGGEDIMLNAIRTHNGLKVYPLINLSSNRFVAMCVQHSAVRSSDGKVMTAFFMRVPNTYHRRWDVIYKLLKTNDLHELRDETDGFSVVQHSADAVSFMQPIGTAPSSMFISDNVSYDYCIYRFGIKLYDQNGAVERILYSSQIVYTPNTDKGEYGFDCEEIFYPDENSSDCYTYGRLITCDDGTNGAYQPFYYKRNSGFDTTVLSTLIYSTQASNGLDAYALLPYDLASNGHPRITAYLRLGDGEKYVLGGCALFVAPDTTAKAAITSGQTFCLDGLWYTATANIGSGEEVVLGTNAEACEMPIVG